MLPALHDIFVIRARDATVAFMGSYSVPITENSEAFQNVTTSWKTRLIQSVLCCFDLPVYAPEATQLHLVPFVLKYFASRREQCRASGNYT